MQTLPLPLSAYKTLGACRSRISTCGVHAFPHPRARHFYYLSYYKKSESSRPLQVSMCNSAYQLHQGDNFHARVPMAPFYLMPISNSKELSGLCCERLWKTDSLCGWLYPPFCSFNAGRPNARWMSGPPECPFNCRSRSPALSTSAETSTCFLVMEQLKKPPFARVPRLYSRVRTALNSYTHAQLRALFDKFLPGLQQ